MNKKTGFIMACEMNGIVREMFNCCGLKEATIESAIADGIKIMNNRKRQLENRYEFWRTIKPVYVKYTEIDENGYVVSVNNIAYV